jgi:hypothetical protein
MVDVRSDQGYIYMVIYPPAPTPLLSCMCVVIMIGDAIGIGADLFSHLSFCLTAAGITYNGALTIL